MYVLAFGFASFLTALFGHFHPSVVIPPTPWHPVTTSHATTVRH